MGGGGITPVQPDPLMIIQSLYNPLPVRIYAFLCRVLLPTAELLFFVWRLLIALSLLSVLDTGTEWGILLQTIIRRSDNDQTRTSTCPLSIFDRPIRCAKVFQPPSLLLGRMKRKTLQNRESVQ